MDMKKFYGKAVGDVMGVIFFPIGYALILARVKGREEGSPDCYALDDVDVTVPKSADDLTDEEKKEYVNVTLHMLMAVWVAFGFGIFRVIVEMPLKHWRRYHKELGESRGTFNS